MLNDTQIYSLDLQTLFAKSTIDAVYDNEDEVERERLKAILLSRAAELKRESEMKKVFRSYDAALKELAEQYTRENARNKSNIPLRFDGRGIPLKTIDNFALVLRQDVLFDGLKYNLLTNSIEMEHNGKLERWKDEDDAKTRNYIEKKYNLYHPQKLEDAIRIVSKEHSYHPIKDIIEAVQWDGVDRIPFMLTRWLKCADTPYTREVSRLIFAGGIHRIYRPGCKFDDVPILIGTKQGEGKSTFVRWLALRDEFFTEVTEIEGQKGAESIEGSWICEIAELLALTKAKEVEAVKSYITKQTDKYRKPFERRVGEWPRQCVFVGTTNKEQFLTDKTGNRRFYPVKCYSDGYELFNHKAEIQAEILQCWAQAKAMFDKNEMPPMANPLLRNEIRKEQENAVEDDYRVGLISRYLENKNETCILDIWINALGYQFSKPSKKESNEITLILQSMPDWVKADKVKRTTNFGVQRVWVRGDEEKAQQIALLPFR